MGSSKFVSAGNLAASLAGPPFHNAKKLCIHALVFTPVHVRHLLEVNLINLKH